MLRFSPINKGRVHYAEIMTALSMLAEDQVAVDPNAAASAATPAPAAPAAASTEGGEKKDEKKDEKKTRPYDPLTKMDFGLEGRRL